ncbi:hypothetical protein HZB01_01410 [Candidatus Woesearchaeota archaeon]|nr:hypothetical protein [Candidatus Woesearchaeota archaeon]
MAKLRRREGGAVGVGYERYAIDDLDPMNEEDMEAWEMAFLESYREAR